MKIKNLNSRGFILLNVIFLTIIVSITATIILNGAARINYSDSALRLTAENLANEQFAELESRAAAENLFAGSYPFLGAAEDLKSYGLYTDKNLQAKTPVEFSVTSVVQNYAGYENLFTAKVTVSWTTSGKNYEIKFEKIIRRKF